MNLLVRLRSIRIQYANNQPLQDMLEMTLHRGVLLRNELIHVLFHLVPWNGGVVLDGLVVNGLLLLDGIEATQTESWLLRWADLLDDTHVHPERHLLLDDIRRHMQHISQLL